MTALQYLDIVWFSNQIENRAGIHFSAPIKHLNSCNFQECYNKLESLYYKIHPLLRTHQYHHIFLLAHFWYSRLDNLCKHIYKKSKSFFLSLFHCWTLLGGINWNFIRFIRGCVFVLIFFNACSFISRQFITNWTFTNVRIIGWFTYLWA